MSFKQKLDQIEEAKLGIDGEKDIKGISIKMATWL